MELSINGRTIDVKLEGQKTFGEIMTLLYQTVLDAEHVVTFLEVNGEEVNNEREVDLGTIPREEITSIGIQTRHPLDLAHETMKTAYEYGGRLIDVLRLNSRGFRLKDSSVNSGADLQACVDGLIWFFEVVETLRVPLKLTGQESVGGGKTWLQLEQESVSAVHEVCEAREKNDLAHMAQAIDYELIPILDQWRQWFLTKTDVTAAIKEIDKKTPPRSGS